MSRSWGFVVRAAAGKASEVAPEDWASLALGASQTAPVIRPWVTEKVALGGAASPQGLIKGVSRWLRLGAVAGTSAAGSTSR